MTALDEDRMTATWRVYRQVALTYFHAGWAPLPLPRNAKKLPPQGFTGYDGRLPSRADIDRWMADPDSGNIAAVMPDGIVGLDVDVYGEKQGAASLATLTKRYGPLPPTYSSTSRGPGPSRIMFFQVPVGTRLRANPMPGIEAIQRHHRYAVAWPSIHPDHGGMYRWYDNAGEEMDGPPNPDDLPPLPWTWVEGLRSVGNGLIGECATTAEVRAFFDEHTEANWRAGLDVVAGKLAEAAAEGLCRHDTLVDKSCWAMREAAAGWYSTTEAADVLLKWWVGVMDDPRRIDGTEFGDALAWAVGQVGADAERIEAMREEHPHIDIDSLVGEHAHHRSDDPVADDLPVPICWPTFWKTDHNEAAWLIEPFLARGRAHAIYAPAKAGKSLFVLDAVAALATGRATMHRRAGDPETVVYLDYEMTESDLQERLEDMGYGPDDDLSRLRYYQLPSLPPLDTAGGGRALGRIVERDGPALVVVDTTGRAVKGEENDADTIRDYYRHSGMMLKVAGITAVRIDHAGKDLERGQRGTSAKTDDVDIVWQLTTADDGVTLRCTHRRVGWVPELVQLRRHTDPLVHRPTPKLWHARTAEVAGLLNDLGVPLDATVRAARTALRGAGTKVRNEAVEDGLKWRKSPDGLL